MTEQPHVIDEEDEYLSEFKVRIEELGFVGEITNFTYDYLSEQIFRVLSELGIAHEEIDHLLLKEWVNTAASWVMTDASLLDDMIEENLIPIIRKRLYLETK
jgi:hypothetical protein